MSESIKVRLQAEATAEVTYVIERDLEIPKDVVVKFLASQMPEFPAKDRDLYWREHVDYLLENESFLNEINENTVISVDCKLEATCVEDVNVENETEIQYVRHEEIPEETDLPIYDKQLYT